MISVYTIKPQFQKLLSPILLFLHKRNITPNQITIGSCFFSLLIGIFFWYADYNNLFFLVLPIGLLLRMAFNALDGMMAKKYNLTSKAGEMLNEMGDVVSDLFVFFPLLKYEPEALYLVVLFIALSIVNEFSGVMGKAISGVRRYDGPMGKSDRALLLGVYGILKFCGVAFSAYSIWIFSVIILLLLISTYVRINKTLKS
ncbi:CDP-alcohol phosphatidyltransferase family protein [Flavobacterium hungaricum]|uniref:CDP-alcohol phosphatidyltransferase family protein n=1 Tax=Flavobacterium hungaricum TaxID=2082725 RepID=A0ABR9TRA1_9FLAO|nr:CDP-alcohol phosphatidyltransferase family protein [Flavobacterium hungaricum]MBE8727907.1 CDP-alcohol phosphatidyltransferase family protein [Flavobacterium hungaricum]